LQLTFGLKKSRFQLLFDKGQRQDSPNLRILSGPGKGNVGIATTRKIGCHARRNKCKRQIAAIIREALSQSKFEPNQKSDINKISESLSQKDWAILVKKDLKDVPHQALVEELLTAFFVSAEKT